MPPLSLAEGPRPTLAEEVGVLSYRLGFGAPARPGREPRQFAMECISPPLVVHPCVIKLRLLRFALMRHCHLSQPQHFRFGRFALTVAVRKVVRTVAHEQCELH